MHRRLLKKSAVLHTIFNLALKSMKQSSNFLVCLIILFKRYGPSLTMNTKSQVETVGCFLRGKPPQIQDRPGSALMARRQTRDHSFAHAGAAGQDHSPALSPLSKNIGNERGSFGENEGNGYVALGLKDAPGFRSLKRSAFLPLRQVTA